MISYVLRTNHETNSFLFEGIFTVLVSVASDIDSLLSETISALLPRTVAQRVLGTHLSPLVSVHLFSIHLSA